MVSLKSWTFTLVRAPKKQLANLAMNEQTISATTSHYNHYNHYPTSFILLHDPKQCPGLVGLL